ncbi:hypothetical protein QAD02_007184 [Eretmocerus hayati]|uniref:Uncharacterized protein n=1 Tax=Eretmocerus hayati TaxID=131215 RepID=A0ACC2N304_9HYME|nr:hypothetical protein QAD02_007184 [Eretmocerus hayati]
MGTSTPTPRGASSPRLARLRIPGENTSFTSGKNPSNLNRAVSTNQENPDRNRPEDVKEIKDAQGHLMGAGSLLLPRTRQPSNNNQNKHRAVVRLGGQWYRIATRSSRQRVPYLIADSLRKNSPSTNAMAVVEKRVAALEIEVPARVPRTSPADAPAALGEVESPIAGEHEAARE